MRHDDQAGSGHVQPVHNQCVGIVRLDAQAQAVLFVGPTPGYRQQPGGFVQYDEKVVDVEDLNGIGG